MKYKVLPLILAGTLLSGCSSIVSKSEYVVAINSSPDGAAFTVTNRAGENVHSGVTPESVVLKASSGYFKGQAYTIVLSKEGYSEQTYTLTSGLDGWYWGNILLGGLLGLLVVDPATGAMYKLPPSVDVTLEGQVAAGGSGDLVLATIDSLTEEQQALLVAVQ